MNFQVNEKHATKSKNEAQSLAMYSSMKALALSFDLFLKKSIGVCKFFRICAIRAAQSPHGRDENVIVAVFVIELGEQCLQLIGWGAFVRG